MKRYFVPLKINVSLCDKVRHERRPARQRNGTGSGSIFSTFHHSSRHNIPLCEVYSYRGGCSLLLVVHHHSYLTVDILRSTSELMRLSCRYQLMDWPDIANIYGWGLKKICLDDIRTLIGLWSVIWYKYEDKNNNNKKKTFCWFHNFKKQHNLA